MLRYPENLDEVSDCYAFVLFTVWHKLKAVKAKERWLPEQEASHCAFFIIYDNLYEVVHMNVVISANSLFSRFFRV